VWRLAFRRSIVVQYRKTRRIMKRILPLLVFALLPVWAAFAQSNEFVDGLLQRQAVTVGQVSYLVLVASDNLGEDADEARAFDLMGSLGWARRGAKSGDTVSLEDYSYILMRAFGMKGGIMYSLVPSARYAYRELVSYQVIQGKSDPASRVDGGTAVRMLGRVFDVMGIAQ
jgi:hypothetical protein